VTDDGGAENVGPAAVIDCDVHNTVASVEALVPYLDAHWREVISTSQFKGPTDTAYPPGAATSLRSDLASEDGAPGTTLESLRRDVLGDPRLEMAILTCVYAADSIKNPDAAAAMASAVNDWQISEWLDREPRLRASIVVPSSQPALAAREIDRVGEHPGFVQVLLPVRSALPYGNRNYYPLLEAAERRSLAVGLHFGGSPGNPPTAVGWPTYYLEEYVGMAGAFQTQLMSLVAEGAFERFPTLRIALLESGFAWLPAFVWRFDRLWRGLRREIPWASREPSATIQERVRIGLQPVDGPEDPQALATLLGQLDFEEMLMFSSDYPHAHRDHAGGELLPGVSEDGAAKVLSGNARALYGL
jgi:hypothetical protein